MVRPCLIAKTMGVHECLLDFLRPFTRRAATALVLRDSRLSDCTAHTADLEDEENNVPAVLLLVG